MNLEVLWLSWFFALWGAIVTFTIAVGAWAIEQLRASEERVAAAQLEPIEPVPLDEFRPNWTATGPVPRLEQPVAVAS